jgi:hypothetical protein
MGKTVWDKALRIYFTAQGPELIPSTKWYIIELQF